MTAMETFLTGPLAGAIGWALLHLLWQGVLVAAILAAALALLQRQSANARYIASCGALVLLVVLGVATTYRAYEPASNVGTGFSPSGGLKPAATLEADVTETPAAPNLLLSFVSYANGHLAQIVAIWLCGVFFLSARLIVGWIGAHRLTTRRAQPAADRWERSLYRISVTLHLRRSIRLLESAAVEVPTVVGWLRPVVLLPIASLSGLSVQQIEMVLAHELAHIRRHDFIVNLMQSVVETLLFYHPAVWWISGRIRAEREHCCDDLAVAVFGDPVQYARALTRFEELRLDAAQTLLAANGGSLITRIRRLVCARAESANWTSRWAAGAALLTVVAAILIAPALPVFANHEEGQTPPSSSTPTSTPAPEKSKNPTTCDKSATTPHATVEVDAEDESSSDDPESDDSESDTSSDEESLLAPHPMPMTIAMPHIAIAPMVSKGVTMALEASETFAQMATPAPDAPEGLFRLKRHKIGEGGKLSVDDLITLRTAGVDPKYINEMRSVPGLGELSLDDIVSMKFQGVTPAYIKDLRDAGVDVTSAQNVVSLRVQGVSAKYVKEMAAAGYPNLSARELIELRVQGVDPAFVKSLADAGYTKLSARELVRLKVSGVDADFIRELSKYRSK
jgi:beta-lactamase regulating signal transducer with metallopeptidase domain